METSYLIAKILAAVYLSVGVGLLFNGSYYRIAFSKLLDDTAYLFLGGWVATSVGVVMVQFHNLWVNDWRLLITIVAWIVLLKGIFLLAFPRFTNMFQSWFTPRGQRQFILPMVFIMGFIFGWYGFFG